MSAPGPRRVALVPGVLALLPEYAGQEDPVADLRAAALAAVAWLAEGDAGGVAGGTAEVAVEVAIAAGTASGARVGAHLLAAVGARVASRDPAAQVASHEPAAQVAPAHAGPQRLLLVGNGSACRTEKAPGFFDPRAADFDTALGEALAGPRPEVLAALDPELATELWADVAALADPGSTALRGMRTAAVDLDTDPFGVQYWVVRWERE